MIDRVRTFVDVARVVRAPWRVAAQRVGPPTVRPYRLRESGIVVHLRSDVVADLATLVQTFRLGHHLPPEAVTRAMAGKRALEVLDLGANIGMFGAWLLGRYPAARVVALEADPDNAAVHALTVSANSAKYAWELIPAAAGTSEGEVDFLAGAATNSRLAEPGEEATVVEMRDVFDYTDHVDLLKLDIEGAEWAILEDERFSSVAASVVALEFHAARCGHAEPRHYARELLARAGYDLYDSEFAAEPGHGLVWGVRAER